MARFCKFVIIDVRASRRGGNNTLLPFKAVDCDGVVGLFWL
jgi:hypothetical protein